jgi:DNA-binding NarL/FixJ family response regulator
MRLPSTPDPHQSPGGQNVKLPDSRDFIRVLLADSNQTQSQLMSGALRRQTGMKIASCGGELSACLQALRSAPFDILLLGDGASEQMIETLRSLHAGHPNVGVIVLVDSYDRNLVITAMRAGARGLFCLAGQPFRALCRCISVIHQGQFWANTEQIGFVIEALASSPSPRVINAKGEGLLTPREEQVVGWVSEGLGNREIALHLVIKENTVKKYLLRIYDKLGVSNRVELVLYAFAHRGAERSATSPAKRPLVSEALDLDCGESAAENLLGLHCGRIPS